MRKSVYEEEQIAQDDNRENVDVINNL